MVHVTKLHWRDRESGDMHVHLHAWVDNPTAIFVGAIGIHVTPLGISVGPVGVNVNPFGPSLRR